MFQKVPLGSDNEVHKVKEEEKDAVGTYTKQ